MELSENFKYLGKVNIKTIKESLNKFDWEKFLYRQETFDVHKHTQSVPLIFDKDFRINNPTYLKDFNLCKNFLTNLKLVFFLNFSQMMS